MSKISVLPWSLPNRLIPKLHGRSISRNSTETLLEASHPEPKEEAIGARDINESKPSKQRKIAFIVTLCSFVAILLAATGITAKVAPMEASNNNLYFALQTPQLEESRCYYRRSIVHSLWRRHRHRP